MGSFSCTSVRCADERTGCIQYSADKTDELAGIFGLILTAIIADSVSVSLIVAVIAAALVGFCGKQQLKYARDESCTYHLFAGCSYYRI